MFNLRGLSRFVKPTVSVYSFQPTIFGSQTISKFSFSPIQPLFIKSYTTEAQPATTETNTTETLPKKPKEAPRLIAIPRYGITVEDFLSRIGKECGSHVEKFKSWDELFTTSSEKMKKLEIPVKQRRWILHWVEKYRQGHEPYSVLFKSKARKNKSKKRANKEKHDSILKALYAKRLAERKERRKALFASVTPEEKVIIQARKEAARLAKQTKPSQKHLAFVLSEKEKELKKKSARAAQLRAKNKKGNKTAAQKKGD